MHSVVPSEVLPHIQFPFSFNLEWEVTILRNGNRFCHRCSVWTALSRKSVKPPSSFCMHPWLRIEPFRHTCWFASLTSLYSSAIRVVHRHVLLCLQKLNDTWKRFFKMISLFCIYPPIIYVFTHNRSCFVCMCSKFASLSYNLAVKSC